MTTTTHAGRRAASFALIAATAVIGAGPATAAVAPEPATVLASELSPSKARIEHLEQQLRDAETAPLGPLGRSVDDPSDPSSVPLTALALLGGGLVTAAAGFSVYRFRHHGNVGPSTA